MIPGFKLVRSKRKSIALVVERDGSLTVRAPLRLGRRQIESLVAEKGEWIRRKQAETLARRPQVHRYAEGELFWYLGQTYPLQVTDGARPALAFEGQHFILQRPAGSPAELGQALFTRWYQASARQVIGGRAAELARQYGFAYARLRITSAGTRWGSCSSKRTLSFAWRLVMAPLPVIDYVVTHELAHLAHHDHSPAFWQAVSALLPDFAARRAWLKINGVFLSISLS